MGESTGRRRVRALAASGFLAFAIGGSTAGTTSPAGAAPTAPADPISGHSSPGSNIIVGDFFGDSREEVFIYNPGPDPDYLLSYSNGGVTGGPITVSETMFSVNRTDYRPFAGNFDGDAKDELFWYAPGTAQDRLWNFTSASSYTLTFPKVDGYFKPLPGDFTGNGVDDIFWYGPGSKPDRMWLGRADGSHVTVRKSVNRHYRPIVGSFGSDRTDDIFWYGPGDKPDVFWDFVRGGKGRHNASSRNRKGIYQPVPLDAFGEGWRGGDILWYKPGTGADPYWDFWQGSRFIYPDVMVNGDYQWFTGDFFGDGEDDIWWYNASNAWVWDHHMNDDGLLELWFYGYDDATMASSEAGTFSTSDGGSLLPQGPMTSTGNVEALPR